MKKGPYSQEELDYIEFYAGSFTLEKLAARMDRSVEGLRAKMNKMGITSMTRHTGKIPACTLARYVGVSDGTVRRWIRLNGLKAVKRGFRNGIKHHDLSLLVTAEDFWEWAEQNKERVPFSKINQQELLPVPTWLETEISKEAFTNKRTLTRKEWTFKEEQELLRLHHKGLKPKEISKILLNRRYTAIKSKLKRLLDAERELAK